MAAPVLSEEQKAKLVEWLVAGFPEPLIRALFVNHGWEPLAQQSLTHYRKRHREAIEARLKEHMDAAFDSGLAQREARVRALVGHAEKLEAVMWLPDEKGKLHNEKAWRETLDDIAREMGHRRLGVDWSQSLGNMSDAELDAYIAAVDARMAATGQGDQGSAADRETSDSGDESLPLPE